MWRQVVCNAGKVHIRGRVRGGCCGVHGNTATSVETLHYTRHTPGLQHVQSEQWTGRRNTACGCCGAYLTSLAPTSSSWSQTFHLSKKELQYADVIRLVSALESGSLETVSLPKAHRFMFYSSSNPPKTSVWSCNNLWAVSRPAAVTAMMMMMRAC